MRDIVLGALLLVFAVLMFVSVVVEWGTIANLLFGGLFVAVALIWLALNGSGKL